MKKLLKRLYSAIPFKKQLFSFIRLFNPPARVYQHLHFKGVFTVKVDGSAFRIKHHGYQVENDLFWAGINNWESKSMELWIRLSKMSNTILDVGANTGVYSLVSGAVNQAARIYAFEPMPAVFERLSENLRLNSFNIQPCDIAASNANGQTSFYVDNTEFTYTASLNKMHQSGSKKIEIPVKTRSLDSFVTENGLRPELVKIDVERHEPAVIEGFLNSIRQYRPALLIEVLDEAVGRELRTLLSGTDYLYFNINETARTAQPMPEMAKGDEFNILACTPETAKKLCLA